MTNSPRPYGRAGFTAIELLVVIGIMMILLGVAVPTMMPAIRRGKINSALNDISGAWRQARILAMMNAIPSGVAPPHFGIVINQTAGQQAYVAVIFDKVTTGIPNLYVQGVDPQLPATWGISGPPVTQYRFNRNVTIASAPASDGTPGPLPLVGASAPAATTADNTIIIYAQYGTGLPITPVDVAANHGLTAAPTSLGVWSQSAAPTSVCPVVRLQTFDYQTSPTRRGYASSFSLYHAGFTAAQEL